MSERAIVIVGPWWPGIAWGGVMLAVGAIVILILTRRRR
jgi:hypothetical protein